MEVKVKIDKQKVHAKYGGKCAYCGRKITVKEMQVDHFHAKIYGGNDDLDNLMPACRDCNNYKYNYSLEQFRRYIEDIYRQLSISAKWRIAERFGIFEKKNNKVTFYFEQE
jgi:5-methylcytosine-specific restriction endonuclease McrA